MDRYYLNFTTSFFHKMNIQTKLLQANLPLPADCDLGLRKEISLHSPISILEFEEIDSNFIKNHIIYICTDLYRCNYILIPLPDSGESQVLLAGPYLTERTDINRTTRLCNELDIPSSLHAFINQYFSSLPRMQEQAFLENYLFTLGEFLYGLGEFQLQYLKQHSKEDTTYVAKLESSQDESLKKRLEDRYELEGQVIDAISRGDFHKAMHYSTNQAFQNIDNRSPNPLRSIKNNLLTFNTLCRKGAELGKVHPIHLDEMSRRMAIKIENMTSPGQDRDVHREILKNYCHMVQEKSTDGYSPTMQRVLNHILQNLTEPTLTLQNTADALSLSKTYLSALFKRETGSTFTSYVNKKRIEHSIFLLNTTDLQIQVIAGECGIPDVNYFSKIFQKEKGMSPSEYKKLIHQKQTSY